MGGGGEFYYTVSVSMGLKLTVLAGNQSTELVQLRVYHSWTGDLMSMIFLFIFTDVLVQVLLTGMQMTSVRFPVRAFLSLQKL